MKLLENSPRAHETLMIEYVPILQLMPNAWNPNVHDAASFDRLVRCLGYYGFTQPIVADRATNTIIDGENRWRAAAVLGIKTVPVCFLLLTEAEMKVATIMHNRARGQEHPQQIAALEAELGQEAAALVESIMLPGRT